MNKVILMGRLTKDVDLKYSNSDSSMAIARYTLAVDRKFAKKDDANKTDFFNCVAFGKAGEFACKYFKKGQRVLVEGRLQLGEYKNKEGQKAIAVNIVVESQEFADGKAGEETKKASNDIMSGFENIDSSDDELPFM
jgi:single-strand DNA-binding protein